MKQIKDGDSVFAEDALLKRDSNVVGGWVVEHLCDKVYHMGSTVTKIEGEYYAREEESFVDATKALGKKFLAFYKGEKKEVFELDLYRAKQAAIKLFDVPRSKQGLLSVMSEESYNKEEFRFFG